MASIIDLEGGLPDRAGQGPAARADRGRRLDLGRGWAMAMSCRRAWLLVESLNMSFREPVVAAQSGGRHGGGARLTAFGRDLVARYRAIEREAAAAADRHLTALEAAQVPGEGMP